MPKSMLYKSLRKNCVKVNKKHIKDGAFKLCEGDVIDLYVREEFFAAPAFRAVPYKLDIVYEDENLLIINKPAGLVVHADDKGTKNTLIEQVQSYLYEQGSYRPEEEHSFAPALANRLDRNTSGLIIAAKNAEALRVLNEKIKSREIKKFYTCIVEGKMEGSGELCGFLTRGDKVVSVSDKNSAKAKAVRLKWRALSHKDNRSVLEIELLTGRTHQIRAQLSQAGHPLAGDVKYGAKKTDGGYKLTSRRLVFDFKTDAGILSYLAGREFTL